MLLFALQLFLAIATVIFIICYFGITFSDYRSDTDNDSVLIKFRTFKKIYELNPNKWELTSQYSSYFKNHVRLKPKGASYSSENKDFCFNYIDYRFKFRPMMKGMIRDRKRKEKQKKIEDAYTSLITEARKEIDAIEEKSKEEINKSQQYLVQGLRGLAR